MGGFNIDDALRYAGVRFPTAEDISAMARRGEKIREAAPARYVYRVFSLKDTEDGPQLSEAGLTLPGELAKQMLTGCQRAALIVCTLGAAFDFLLRAQEKRDMAEALLLDGCGSAAVEAGCDEAEREIAARFPGMYLTDRFSPGYGDLPLTLQPQILTALNAEKRLGVHAAPSCLLMPVKTVTALVGIASSPRPARIRGCDHCALRENCALRKGGNGCGLEK